MSATISNPQLIIGDKSVGPLTGMPTVKVGQTIQIAAVVAAGMVLWAYLSSPTTTSQEFKTSVGDDDVSTSDPIKLDVGAGDATIKLVAKDANGVLKQLDTFRLKVKPATGTPPQPVETSIPGNDPSGKLIPTPLTPPAPTHPVDPVPPAQPAAPVTHPAAAAAPTSSTPPATPPPPATVHPGTSVPMIPKK